MCVWGWTTKAQLHKLQKVINFAARIVTGTKKHQRITSTLSSLGWPRIEVMVTHSDLVKVFRTLMEEGVPRDTRALFTPRSTVSQRETRATDHGRLHLCRPKLATTQRVFRTVLPLLGTVSRLRSVALSRLALLRRCWYMALSHDSPEMRRFLCG